jgi:hypothetical protein
MKNRVRVETVEYLIIDDTLASLHSPDSLTTNGPWDAMAAPALYHKGKSPRVLILGLGGGSVARVISAICPDATMVGVECDAEVLKVAKEEFGLGDIPNLEIVKEDALTYLRGLTEANKYDIIIDDVFVGVGENSNNPIWLPGLHHLIASGEFLDKEHGVLVCNTIANPDKIEAGLKELFPENDLFNIQQREDYNNVVFVSSPGKNMGTKLKTAIEGDPVLGSLSFESMEFESETEGII